MIDGLSHLVTMRRGGMTPATVWLSIGGQYRPPVDNSQIELVAHGTVIRDDFRAFKGLDVTLFSPEWNDIAEESLSRLKEHAAAVTILCAAYKEDIGYFWTMEHGNIELDDYKWVKQYHEARCTVCRTHAETAERIRLENEAIAHVPSLGAH